LRRQKIVNARASGRRALKKEIGKIMKVEIAKSDHEIIYRINGFNPDNEKELEGMFFKKVDNYYEKRYSIESLMFHHDFEQIEKRFDIYINKEFKKEYKKEEFESTLVWIIKNHNKENVKWWLTGSTALFIRGIDVEPHDIDIMTYKTEIDKIEKCIKDYIIEPFHHVTDWVVKGFGVIDYQYRIDYAFEPEEWVDSQGKVDFGLYAQSNLNEIEWNGFKVKVPKIELHIKSNEDRKRYDVVKKINTYIQNK
jgi:hypothetical protein